MNHSLRLPRFARDWQRPPKTTKDHWIRVKSVSLLIRHSACSAYLPHCYWLPLVIEVLQNQRDQQRPLETVKDQWDQRESVSLLSATLHALLSATLLLIRAGLAERPPKTTWDQERPVFPLSAQRQICYGVTQGCNLTATGLKGIHSCSKLVKQLSCNWKASKQQPNPSLHKLTHQQPTML